MTENMEKFIKDVFPILSVVGVLTIISMAYMACIVPRVCLIILPVLCTYIALGLSQHKTDDDIFK